MDATTIAQLNGYTLTATNNGDYAITEPDTNQEFNSWGMLTINRSLDLEAGKRAYSVGVNTTGFSESAPEFVARYAQALAVAAATAAHFNTILAA